MPKTGHVHTMMPLIPEISGAGIFPTEKAPLRELPFVGVLMSCQKGVCANTQMIRVHKGLRTAPDGLTQEEFERMKAELPV